MVQNINKSKKPRTPRPKQPHLPTMEPEIIEELENAVTTYNEAKTERVVATVLETKTRESLIEKMVSHRLTRYETQHSPPLIVDMLSKSSITVKPKKGSESNGTVEE